MANINDVVSPSKSQPIGRLTRNTFAEARTPSLKKLVSDEENTGSADIQSPVPFRQPDPIVIQVYKNNNADSLAPMEEQKISFEKVHP